MDSKTTLYFADLSTLTSAKIKSLQEKAEGTKVFISQGQLASLSINTNVDPDLLSHAKSIMDFEFESFENIRKKFLSYDNKFIVEGNDVFLNTVIEQFNLMGRKDVGVLNFGPDLTADKALEIANMAMSMIREQTNTISELRLQISALIEILPEDLKAHYLKILSATKKSVSETLAIQRAFMAALSKETSVTIEEAVSHYCEANKLDALAPSVLQNYEKICGLSADEFAKRLETKFTGPQLITDSALLHSFLASYAAAFPPEVGK